MPKNFLQDMVKIKHIKQKIPINQEDIQKQNKSTWYSIWLVASACLVFLFFALSFFFSQATITVNPKMKDLVLNENLSASQDGNTDILSFDLVVISGEESKVVQATDEKEISQKAEGLVVIYNAFNSSPQRLDIDTRLEGSNGKIYKTKKRISVPGMAKDNTPGSVEVEIYGNEAGEKYNNIPLDFKIVGFKGTNKYSKFYGRSKGAITGGLKGKFPIISDSQKARVVNELQTTLQTKLSKKVTDQIPSGFILFKDGFFFNTDDSNIDFTFSESNRLPIKLQGTFYGLLFDESQLTKKIAENNVEEYDGNEIFIPNIRTLTFSLPPGSAGLSDKDNISLGDIKNINFNLSGTTKVVWKLDTDKLTADLLGKSKKDFNQILLQYPNIDSANLILSPIWARSLPNKIKNIKMIVNYPK